MSTLPKDVVLDDGAPPGVRRLAFYCDESAIGGDLKHYAFGAIIMQYQRRGEFVRAFRTIFDGDGSGEIKWNKAGPGKLRRYKNLVDYFFKTSSLYFHCIVVERAWVNKRLHSGSLDLARRKHFTKFLANKVGRITSIDPNRQHDFRVYVDRIASSYKKADEAVQVIGNNIVNQKLVERGLASAARASPIKRVIEVESKDRPEVQLCDLLLGAVTDSRNGASSSDAKAELKKHIASYLGWDSLKHGTFASERKFNVWWLTDRHATNAERKVRAEPVRLVHPLPAARRYRAT